jgi:hypothetical protein
MQLVFVTVTEMFRSAVICCKIVGFIKTYINCNMQKMHMNAISIWYCDRVVATYYCTSKHVTVPNTKCVLVHHLHITVL